MPRNRVKLLVFLTGICAFSTVTYLIQTKLSARKMNGNESIHALVYNKPISLLDFELIANYKNTEENISVYATLEDFEKIETSEFALHLREFENHLIAYSYSNLPPLEIGRSYLFEGYIEVIDGQNRFIIETIENPLTTE